MIRDRLMRWTRLTGLGACLILTEAVAQPPVCEMSFSFWQTDKDARSGKTAVWSDPVGNLMFIEKLNVNTDGTRRSYSVQDFWGETRAINNLCNAMSDACAGLSTAQLRERRIATQEAAREGWPTEKLKATRLSPDIIPMPGGKPCPEVDGFLVSATALHAARITDACALENYVDALQVPAIVIPKNTKAAPSQFLARNARVGDLVAALRIDQSEPVMAVIGDTGPTHSLGEATVAMNRQLLGKTGDPAHYKEARRWGAPPTWVLIFAGSRNTEQPYMTSTRIDTDARSRFAEWGGVARAQACISEYRSKHPG